VGIWFAVELRPGEKIRVALLSVTEGEDKPLKYPTLFNSADAAVITKMDIAEPCGLTASWRSGISTRSGRDADFETSSKTGRGWGVAGLFGGERVCGLAELAELVPECVMAEKKVSAETGKADVEAYLARVPDRADDA